MPTKTTTKFTHHLKPLNRVIAGLLFAGTALLLLNGSKTDWMMRAMIAWDLFALVYAGITWIIFLNHDTEDIKRYANKEDGSRAFVFALVLLSSFASMLTVLLLMLSHNATDEFKGLYLGISIPGMLLSWVMVHSTYALHYAHLFYDSDDGQPAGGLDFPGNEDPDYIDFAYFSFIIGMTFQVSDVQITSKLLRRVVLVHSILAFALNSFVVALTINLVAGLRS